MSVRRKAVLRLRLTSVRHCSETLRKAGCGNICSSSSTRLLSKMYPRGTQVRYTLRVSRVAERREGGREGGDMV